jgi:hypothetical protein
MDSIFPKRGWERWIFTGKRAKLDTSLIAHSLKVTKDLSGKAKSTKLLEETFGKCSCRWLASDS